MQLEKKRAMLFEMTEKQTKQSEKRNRVIDKHVWYIVIMLLITIYNAKMLQ